MMWLTLLLLCATATLCLAEEYQYDLTDEDIALLQELSTTLNDTRARLFQESTNFIIGQSELLILDNSILPWFR